MIPPSWTLTRLADDHVVVKKEFPDTQFIRNCKEAYAFKLDKYGKLDTTCYKKGIYTIEETTWINGKRQVGKWVTKRTHGKRETYSTLKNIMTGK